MSVELDLGNSRLCCGTGVPAICLSTVFMAQCNDEFICVIESCILKMLLISDRCPFNATSASHLSVT
jgi:hypothetical protein